MRRIMPPTPRKCIGKNTQLKNTNVRMAWICPSRSFIVRPKIFGYQYAMAANIAKMIPATT